LAYLGNQPSNNFVSLKRQVITGNGGSTYTLDHAVASVNDVAIFVNNVRQDPASYSISGTALTLGGTISSSDSCYVIFLGQALQTVTPDANTITTAMIQNDAVTSAKVSGLGNYVVEKIDEYHYGTEVTTTGATNYIDIAAGNTINFTPTSTNDIIFITGMNLVFTQSAQKGIGIGIMRGTSSTISSSDTVVARTGRHAIYINASSNYQIAKIIATETGLSAGTTVYYEMFGMVHGDSSERKWNVNVSNATDPAKHKLIGIHYKYIG